MAHHARTSEEYALPEINISNTPVTINLYDPRLAHTTQPGINIVDGKVKIDDIGVIQTIGHLPSIPSLDVRPSCEPTYNVMVPYPVRGEPEWTRRYSHWSYEDGTTVNRVHVPVEPSEHSVEDYIRDETQGGTGYERQGEEAERTRQAWEDRREREMENRRRRREGDDDCCCCVLM